MAQAIEYTVTVDGKRRTETFTADDVGDNRVTTDRDVAEAYAQHLAVDAFGYGIDVTTVAVTLPDTGC